MVLVRIDLDQSMSAPVLCDEYCRSTRAVRNCTRDEGGPFEVGIQVSTSSHRKLLSSKAMAVNVAETPGQYSGRQGWERRAQAKTVDEVSKADYTMSKPGGGPSSGISLSPLTSS
jgi:hypothetical protein